MYVCHCRAVTDHTIEREVVERGASTIEDLAECCGAGSECGGCWPVLEELLDRYLTRELASAPR